MCAQIENEIADAKIVRIRAAQGEAFPEYSQLKKGKSLTASSKPIHLRSLMNEQGVIRVEGRTQNAEFLSMDAKHPIILPCHSLATRFIVKEQHEAANHAGDVNHIWSLAEKMSENAK